MLPYVDRNIQRIQAKIARRRARGITPHSTLPTDNSQLPITASLRPWCPIACDQGTLGSCSACSVCGFVKMTDETKSANPSRLYLYTKALQKEHLDHSITDTGADALDEFEIMSTTGICDEIYMPYSMDSNGKVLNFGQPPSAQAEANARQHIYAGAKDVTHNGPALNTIRWLIANGYPVPLEIMVYQSMMMPNVMQTGFVPTPTAAELAAQPYGGHALLGVEYDANYVTALNSWGPNRGQSGYFKFPNAYFDCNGIYGSIIMQILMGKQVPGFSGPQPSPPQPSPPQPSPPQPSPPQPSPPQPQPGHPDVVDMMNQMSQAIQTLCTIQNQLVNFLPQLSRPLQLALPSLQAPAEVAAQAPAEVAAQAPAEVAAQAPAEVAAQSEVPQAPAEVAAQPEVTQPTN